MNQTPEGALSVDDIKAHVSFCKKEGAEQPLYVFINTSSGDWTKLKRKITPTSTILAGILYYTTYSSSPASISCESHVFFDNLWFARSFELKLKAEGHPVNESVY